MTCSQLSSTSSIGLPLRAAIKPRIECSEPISGPSASASALGTRRGSTTGARSTNPMLMPVRFEQPPGYREGNRGLADAARADDRDEAPPRQLGRERRHHIGAVDHAHDLGRQIVRSLTAAGREHFRDMVTGATKR